jgi:ubiquinone/menaquinone biosynthesis C-methylase UbiE
LKQEEKHIRLNEKMWNKWASSIDGKGWKYDSLRDAQGKLISLLDIKENIHFLDIGCGTGWAVGEAAKLVDNKGLFYGIDLSPKMIEKAKDKFGDKDNFHFIQANSESIPLNDNFFDVIICANSFHHYLNPDKALNEMFRLLKKGGKIYILDPTADNWIIKVADKIIKLVEPEHVKLYSTKEFQRLFENARLTHTSSQTIKTISKVHIGEK